MAIKILPDENCVGQFDAIFKELDSLGYVELLEIELLTWNTPGLTKSMDDDLLWNFCQDNNCFLITGNRTGKDGKKSLEFIIRDLFMDTSLPVLTIGNLKRVLPDPEYCSNCAQRLAETLFDLDKCRGVTRLYLSKVIWAFACHHQ